MVPSRNFTLHLAMGAITNTTSSTTHFAGWMSEPDGRGTTGLLWSYLSTILLCTWTVIHLDVSRYGHHFTSQILSHRLQWMLGTIFAPEIVSLRAVIEYQAAKHTFHTIQPLYETQNDQTPKLEIQPHHGSPRVKGRWSMTHAFFSNSQGFAVERPEGSIQLRGEQTIQMVEKGYLLLENFPNKNEILEKAEADSLTKTVTCLQALWLAAQVVGRAAQHLPITTLEVTTMSFVVCMLLSYLCWWSKAQNVEHPIPVKMQSSRRDSEILCGLTDDLSIHTYTKAWAQAFRNEHDYWTSAAFVLICLLVGGIHCTAWNFEFPSYAERLLWRMASIASAVLPACLFFVIRVVMNSQMLWVNVTAMLNGLFMVLYCIVRVFLILEVFLGLRLVPIGVYKEIHWLTFIPHF